MPPVISVEHLPWDKSAPPGFDTPFDTASPVRTALNPADRHPVANAGRAAGTLTYNIKLWWAKMRDEHNVSGHGIIVLRNSTGKDM